MTPGSQISGPGTAHSFTGFYLEELSSYYKQLSATTHAKIANKVCKIKIAKLMSVELRGDDTELIRCLKVEVVVVVVEEDIFLFSLSGREESLTCNLARPPPAKSCIPHSSLSFIFLSV